MADNVLEFTDGNFQSEVVESDQPVLVDFWATWCGPCKMIAPTIEELASDYDGKARIGKVDIDQNQEVAMQHGIQATTNTTTTTTNTTTTTTNTTTTTTTTLPYLHRQP